MTDVSDLTWYLNVDIDLMTVDYLAQMIQTIGAIGGGKRYDIGNDESQDGIQLVYDNGILTLYLNQITDSDMPDVLDILIQYSEVRIKEIFHEALSRRFSKKFELMGVQMLDVYEAVLKQCKYDSQDVWEYWKDESGFYDFVKEVYDDE